MRSLQNTLLGSIIVSNLLISSVLADVKFSSPAAGATISGSTIEIEFAEGGEDPPISDLTQYVLQLCAGGNGATDFVPLFTFTDKGAFSKSTYDAKLTNLAIGGKDKNAYFLSITSSSPKGTVINYSDRFTLSGMNGEFSAAVKAGLAKVSGTSGPASVNNVLDPPKANPAAAVPAADVGDPKYQVEYTMQTGIIRYAPMPKQAPSKITAKGDARQHSTSAYNIWSRSNMPPPDATQTVTEAYTYVVSSMEPTIAPQPPPDDMQKFLNRWRD